MNNTGPEHDPFTKLTDEQIETRIRAAKARLTDIELEDITEGDVLPDDLPPPDTYGTLE